MKLDDRMKELIALGTAVGVNCRPCLRHHLEKAQALNIGAEEIADAFEVGRMVRRGAAGQTDKLAAELLSKAEAQAAAGPAACGCEPAKACG